MTKIELSAEMQAAIQEAAPIAKEYILLNGVIYIGFQDAEYANSLIRRILPAYQHDIELAVAQVAKETESLRVKLQHVYGIFGDYEQEVTDWETANEIWNEQRNRVIKLETELTNLNAELASKDRLIVELRELGEKLSEARTAWLRQHGVPISMEFVKFADAIGSLLLKIYAQSKPPAQEPPR